MASSSRSSSPAPVSEVVSVLTFRSPSVKAVPYDDKILTNPAEWSYNYALGYKQLASGLCCGLSSLAAGLAIGVVGDAGVRANGQKNILIALILMMIFAEALALYGFIIAIVLVMSA